MEKTILASSQPGLTQAMQETPLYYLSWLPILVVCYSTAEVMFDIRPEESLVAHAAYSASHVAHELRDMTPEHEKQYDIVFDWGRMTVSLRGLG